MVQFTNNRKKKIRLIFIASNSLNESQSVQLISICNWFSADDFFFSFLNTFFLLISKQILIEINTNRYIKVKKKPLTSKHCLKDIKIKIHSSFLNNKNLEYLARLYSLWTLTRFYAIFIQMFKKYRSSLS